MISNLPKRSKNFSEDTIDISYLEPDMDDVRQMSLEMMLPVPKWVQEKELEVLLQSQTEKQVEDIFGQTYDLKIDTKLVLDKKGEEKETIF